MGAALALPHLQDMRLPVTVYNETDCQVLCALAAAARVTNMWIDLNVEGPGLTPVCWEAIDGAGARVSILRLGQ
eukprot:jgi/Ulvmu1/7173/UM034_0082.1